LSSTVSSIAISEFSVYPLGDLGVISEIYESENLENDWILSEPIGLTHDKSGVSVIVVRSLYKWADELQTESLTIIFSFLGLLVWIILTVLNR